MSNATYRVEPSDQGEKYTCLVPFMGREGDICGHWSTDFTLFKQHMEQYHGGEMIQAGEPEPPAEPEPDEPDPDKPEPVPAPAPPPPAEEPVPEPV